jgi:hypothetical protein
MKDDSDMQDIGLVCGSEPELYRPEGSSVVYLTFRGLRDAKVSDRDYRVRITLAVAQAAELQRRLGEVAGLSSPAE